MKTLEYLEIARGLAALLVVLHHATLGASAFYGAQPFLSFFYFGGAGVDFFFVLSGFIIYFIHSEDKSEWSVIKTYILKRIIRIYPIFLLISFILLIAYLVFPHWSPRGSIIDLQYLVTSLLLLPSGETPLLTVSWTLVHEMFFYMLFILVILNKNIGILVFLSWGLLIILVNMYFNDLAFPFHFYLNSHNLEFLMGIGVAYLVKSKQMQLLSGNKSIALVIIGITIFLMNGINLTYGYVPIGIFNKTLLYGLSSAMIVFGLVTVPNPKHKSILIKSLLLVGGASYSIYLIHNPLISVLNRVAQKLNVQEFLFTEVTYLCIVCICICIGILFHLIIEKPILKYLRRKI